MRLKLGTYSLKIKSFTASELGLDTSLKNLSFGIYQKVFHFWYIPIFPVEKHWKIKDVETGKEMVETTAQMRTAIDLQLLKKRSPIWSYSGILLIALPLLFLVGFFLYDAVDEAVDGVEKNMRKNDRVAQKMKFAETPNIGDRYTFKILNVDMITDMNGHFVRYEPSYFSTPYDVDFLLNYMTKDSVGFEFIKKEGLSDYTYGLKKEFRLSKTELLSAAKGYQDLHILKYPNKQNDKTKDVVGIFEIIRGKEMVAN